MAARRRLAGRMALALLGLLLLEPAASGQPPEDAVVLRPEVQQRLAALQTDWLEWLTAAQAGDEQRASLAAEQLLKRTRETGLERLPGLGIAAAAKAVSFAEAGREEGAERALEVAESLDPGRPETAFARAAAARANGRHVASWAWNLRGWQLLASLPVVREVLLSNLLIWLLNALAMSALAFIGVQMATRGQLLYRDLLQALSRSLPPGLAHLLTLAILLWPALLPAGLLWVAFFWSILLWGYGTRAERAVMVTVWVFLGALPFLVSEQARRMDLAVSRPVRAIESVASGRLEGSLFADLQVLHALLPDSVPVKHLTADLHLKLRQWDLARALYRQVLAAEPGATAALTDLGTSLFYEGDLDSAVSALEDAIAQPDATAVAYFNLGRAYAEDLRFDKQAPMTQQASLMADEDVRQWLQADVSEQVICEAGGFERRHEIRRELSTVWREGEGDPALISPWRRMLSLPLALVFILPAIALYFLKRRARNRSRRLADRWWTGWLEIVRRTLLPGIPEAEQGRSLRGLASLVLLIALLTLSSRALVAYTLPLGFDAPMAFWAWVGLAGVIVFFAVRLEIERRRPRKD